MDGWELPSPVHIADPRHSGIIVYMSHPRHQPHCRYKSGYSRSRSPMDRFINMSSCWLSAISKCKKTKLFSIVRSSVFSFLRPGRGSFHSRCWNAICVFEVKGPLLFLCEVRAPEPLAFEMIAYSRIHSFRKWVLSVGLSGILRFGPTPPTHQFLSELHHETDKVW